MGSTVPYSLVRLPNQARMTTKLSMAMYYFPFLDREAEWAPRPAWLIVLGPKSGSTVHQDPREIKPSV